MLKMFCDKCGKEIVLDNKYNVMNKVLKTARDIGFSIPFSISGGGIGYYFGSHAGLAIFGGATVPFTLFAIGGAAIGFTIYGAGKIVYKNFFKKNIKTIKCPHCCEKNKIILQIK
ncbi:MAG: hypothetical protein LBP54_07115 [Campylobacteraceae bacterium]|jgi:uncharacterized oligopeptide transporter (OPT) family protein|nr:hypothetical protein [Campylobacteraceae bacterium]